MAKPGPRTTPRYSRDFKAPAVRLSLMPGVAVQDVAQSLYIHPFMLSRWRKQAREGMIVTKGTAVEKDVLAELKVAAALAPNKCNYTDTSLQIRRLEPFELAWANERYSEVDFVPSTSDDLIALALVNDAPAALGRATRLGPSVGELGGIYVFPNFQGRGIAKHLVSYLVHESALDTLFCLPFERLQVMYEACGFTPHPTGLAVPEKVLSKHAWCNQHYEQRVLLMSRRGQAAI